MDIRYTKHALDRMAERNILKEDIRSLLQSQLLKVKSKQDEDVFLLMGYANGKGIVLIIDETTSHLITVRNMRKNEKVIFEAKGGLSNG
jgi:hypothetical protein